MIDIYGILTRIEEYIEYSFDMNIGLFQVYGIKRPWHSYFVFVLCWIMKIYEKLHTHFLSMSEIIIRWMQK